MGNCCSLCRSEMSQTNTATSPSSGAVSSSEHRISDEVMAVLPSDQYEQLDLTRKINSLAIDSRVSRLDIETRSLKQKLTENHSLLAELQGQVLQVNRAREKHEDPLTSALEENDSRPGSPRAGMSHPEPADLPPNPYQQFPIHDLQFQQMIGDSISKVHQRLLDLINLQRSQREDLQAIRSELQEQNKILDEKERQIQNLEDMYMSRDWRFKQYMRAKSDEPPRSGGEDGTGAGGAGRG